ncbi:metallophosphoesterase family protein [Saccharibacillus sacchari]|uniref:Metallophosphoesterase family protein n=1 Tax=Saccharibacillus sacchari TaxID=456493 RepID=A0ACC6P921_9BACL
MKSFTSAGLEKIALITDIHGNAPALQAVLAELDRRGIDRIYSLGDVIGIGPDSNEAIELLMNRPNLHYVSGNHEDAVLAAYEGRPAPAGHEGEREHHAWLAARLNPAYAKVMASWPRQLEMEIEGRKLLFTHYHTDRQGSFLPINAAPSIEALDAMYLDTPYDLIAFGHHHIVHEFCSDQRMYFNPGALGCGGAVARFGVIEIDPTGISAETVGVPYDNSAFLRAYHELGVPDADFILRIFHGVGN